MGKRGLVSLYGILCITVVLFVGTLVVDNEPLLGLDLQGGVSVVLQPTEPVDNEQLDQSIEIIRRRIDSLGVAEPEITRQGDTILVQIPGVDDTERALDLVGQTAELRFRPVLGLTTEGGDPAAATTTTGVPGTTVPGAPGTTVAAGDGTTLAPADTPAPLRLRAAFTATAIAESYRDQGKNVLLMMDSVTRFAMAQREIGLAIGESPATRGYTPSVFALLPRLLERAGAGERGTITALYTVLVEGDDMNEPVADAVRGILDGHVVLSRQLAHFNHFPAIDILESVSRLNRDLCTQQQLAVAAQAREVLALYRKNEDLVSIGAYQKGASAALDRAIALQDPLNRLLRQEISEITPRAESFSRLEAIIAR
jgi:hypothetical protein